MTGRNQRLRSAVLIGFFVFLFLYVFRPFGLANVKGSLLFVTFLYGMVTFAILLITQLGAPLVLRSFYDESKWTVGKEIIQSMANILIIAIGNFLLSAFLEFFPWSTKTFLLFLGFTLAVGILPVTVQVLVRQNLHHRRNKAAVDHDNLLLSERAAISRAEGPSIYIKSEDGKIAFQGKASEIIALSSSGNYVEVFKKEEKPLLVRNALSTIEKDLPEFFFRTHRSWVVNLENISHVEGNARGYTVIFDESHPAVPVSRNKLKEFDAALQRVVQA